MICYPNAKINIGLNIISKRMDGYHNLNSIFYPIFDVYDILEVVESKKFEFTTSGAGIDCLPEKNLCYKVYTYFKEKYDIPNIKIHLHKNIPIGSGLGGGSSDAAFLLKYLCNENDNQNIINKSKEIGADCPFFIENSIKFIRGIGEKMENIDIDIKDKIILVVDPKKGISTKDAYKNINPEIPKYNLKKILENENIENWKKYISNSFEEYAMNKINDLNKIKKYLYNEGAKYVSLTGSGSCIYGIFETKNISTKDLKYNSYIVNPII